MPSPAHPRSSRRRARTIFLALFALLLSAAPVSAAPPHLETWHRLNPDTENVAAEHERLQCLPGVQWVCRYDKVPDPGYHWDRTIAMFHGRDITDIAECPTPDEPWFPQEICDGATQVIAGTAHFSVADGGAFRTGQALIFTDGDGLAPLYIYWFDFGFICPWYVTFQDAVDANPDVVDDCVFAE
jgi:hypothetical protein